MTTTTHPPADAAMPDALRSITDHRTGAASSTSLELLQYRPVARAAARSLLADPATVLLDSETTTLFGELIEISVTTSSGVVLFDTLVRPRGPIAASATAVHGLVDADVAGAPDLADVLAQLRPVLAGRRVVAYNSAYDRSVLAAAAASCDQPELEVADWVCAMDLYSAWRAEPSTRDPASWRNQRLPSAEHRSAGDCRALAAVLAAVTERAAAPVSVDAAAAARVLPRSAPGPVATSGPGAELPTGPSGSKATADPADRAWVAS